MRWPFGDSYAPGPRDVAAAHETMADEARRMMTMPPDADPPSPPPLGCEPVGRTGVSGRLVVFVMLAIMGFLLLIVLT